MLSNTNLEPLLFSWELLRLSTDTLEIKSSILLFLESCDRPVFENAGTKNNSTWFKINDELDYECQVGYENRHKDTKGYIKCTADGWSEKPSCYGEYYFF